MELEDVTGHDVLLANRAAGEAWNGLIRGFLAHSATTPGHLADVLAEAPDFALGHATRGLFCLMLGRREMAQVAREASRTAHGSLNPEDARATVFLEALDFWLAGAPTVATEKLSGWLNQHPDDALAVKIDHSIRFMLGDIRGMRRAIENVLPAYEDGHPLAGYLFGCHAFALEEMGDHALAERQGRAGLALASDDAWGLHAVTHVFDMQGNSSAGIAWLDAREDAWVHCNNFRYHVWWHKALLHLDLGQIDAVLDLYDRKIRSDHTDDYRDISNATSLLMRLELEGVAVGDRWEELADLSARRSSDGCVVFADLHYLLGLMGGEKTAALSALISRMQKRACSDSEMGRITSDPGLAAAKGLAAFGEGDNRTAFLNLRVARKNLPKIGGSHAQRDVFERLTIDAGIRAGYCADAALLLEERRILRAGRHDRFGASRSAMINQSLSAREAAE